MKETTKNILFVGGALGVVGIGTLLIKKIFNSVGAQEIIIPEINTSDTSTSSSDSSSGSTNAATVIEPEDNDIGGATGFEDGLMSSTGEDAESASQNLNTANNNRPSNIPTNPQTPEERIILYRWEQSLIGDSAPGGVGHYAYMQYEYLIAKAQAEIEARNGSSSSSGSTSGSTQQSAETAKALAIAKANSDIAYWQNIIYEKQEALRINYPDFNTLPSIVQQEIIGRYQMDKWQQYLSQAQAALETALAM